MAGDAKRTRHFFPATRSYLLAVRSAFLKFSTFGVVALSAACQHDLVEPENLGLRAPTGGPVDIISPEENFKRGIYYFAGWTNVPGSMPYSGTEVPHRDNTQWNLIRYPHSDPLWYFDYSSPDRTPTTGFVDEDQQWIADGQIDAMANAHFDYVAYQVGWSHNVWKANHSDPARVYFDYAIRNHITSSKAGRVNFAITWHDVQASDSAYWTGWSPEEYHDDMQAMFSAWFDNYINASPYFYKVGGTRPLIVFFAPQDMKLLADTYGWESPASIIALLRSVAAQKGFSGASTPYLLATNIPDDYVSTVASWDFDATTAYAWNAGLGHQYSEVMNTYIPAGTNDYGKYGDYKIWSQ